MFFFSQTITFKRFALTKYNNSDKRKDHESNKINLFPQNKGIHSCQSWVRGRCIQASRLGDCV